MLVQVEAAHSLGRHAHSSLRRNKVRLLVSWYGACANDVIHMTFKAF